MPSNSSEYNKTYYEENRGKWDKYRGRHVRCNACDKLIRKCSKPRHERSKAHMRNVVIHTTIDVHLNECIRAVSMLLAAPLGP